MGRKKTTRKKAMKTEPTVSEVEIPTRGRPALKAKPPHPEVAAAIDAEAKLAKHPEDFMFGSEAPIPRKLFATTQAFHDYKACDYEARAQIERDKAELARKQGTGQQRATLMRIKRMGASRTELEASLEAQGIDVDEALAAMEGD